MVVKIYISGISGNKEVKKRQQRVLMILDSKNVKYEIIDITEPDKADDKEFMQTNSNPKDSKYPLLPQIFNDEDYCGDYEDFDLSNEMDELEKFLKLISAGNSPDKSIDESNAANSTSIRQNGNSSSREASTDKDVANSHAESEERDNSTVEDKDVDDKSKSSELDGADESGDKNQEGSDEQEKEE